MKPFAFSIATSPDDAVTQQSRRPRSAFIAGGTNLVDLMRENVSQPEALIDIIEDGESCEPSRIVISCELKVRGSSQRNNGGTVA